MFLEQIEFAMKEYFGPHETLCTNDLRLIPRARGEEWECSHKEHKGHKEMERINPHWLQCAAPRQMRLRLVCSTLDSVVVGG